METGGGSQRRRSFPEEKVDSPNLRDFLRVKEDNDGRNYTGLTLSAVLGPSPSQVNRTLLDIIRDDPNVSTDSKKSWKSLKDKLLLRRAGAAWTSSVPTPSSDVPIGNNNRNRMISRRNSTRFPTANSENESTHPENRAQLNTMQSNRAMMLRRNSSRVPSLSTSRYGGGVEVSTSIPFNRSENETGESAVQAEDERQEEEEEGGGEAVAVAEEEEEPAVRTSLMALLAETDREMGLDESTYTMDDVEEEDEEEEESGSGGGGEYNNCCVCMVRHKGSAFIPCGHTFCRLCSRELWVQRGNCPICNGFILEILDIF